MEAKRRGGETYSIQQLCFFFCCVPCNDGSGRNEFEQEDGGTEPNSKGEGGERTERNGQSIVIRRTDSELNGNRTHHPAVQFLLFFVPLCRRVSQIPE